MYMYSETNLALFTVPSELHVAITIITTINKPVPLIVQLV